MKVIRIGLLFLFAFSVFAFGAVEVWAESLLEIGASILLIYWAVIVCRDKQSRDSMEPSQLAPARVYRNRHSSTGFSLDPQSIPYASGIA